MNSGTFQGMMPADTPTGSLRTMTGPSAPGRISSNGNVSARSAQPSSTIEALKTWPMSAQLDGEPISAVMVSASSWDRVWMASDSLRRYSARSAGLSWA